MEKKLKILLAIAAILRLLVFMQLAMGNGSAIYDPDSDGYTVIAKAISHGDVLATGSEAKESTVFRVIGYPAFLSFFYLLGLNGLAISFIQLIVDVFNIWLIFNIASTLFKSKSGKDGGGNGHAAAYMTAFLYAISPLFISFFFKILTETLFTFVFLLSLYFYSKNQKYNSAFTLGALILIKPVAIFYPLALAAYNYFTTRNRKESLLLLFIPLVISSLWVLRNYEVLGKATFSGISTLNYVCWNAVYLANDVGLDNPQWKGFIQEHRLETFEGCQRRPFEEIEAQVPEINRFVGANLPLYVKQYVKGAITFFAPATPNNLLKALGMEEQAVSLTYIYLQKGFDIGFVLGYVMQNWAYAVILFVSLAYQLVVYGFFAAGVFRLYKSKNYALLGFVLVLIIYNIVATGPVANYRFRIPVEPLILIVAGYGAQDKIHTPIRKKSLN